MRFFLFTLLATLLGCSPIQKTAQPADSLGPVTDDSPISPAPVPSFAGNGEPYNGPHFGGMSVPSKPDEPLQWNNILDSLDRCLFRSALTILGQIYGETVRPTSRQRSFTPRSAKLDSDEFILEGSSTLFFRIRSQTWQLSLRGPVISNRRQSLHEDRHFFVETGSISRIAPNKTILESSAPLPGLTIPTLKLAWDDDRGGVTPQDLYRTVPAEKNDPTIAMFDITHGGLSPVRFNIKELNLCLDIETQLGQETIFPNPSGEPSRNIGAPKNKELLDTFPVPQTITEPFSQKAHWERLELAARELFARYLSSGWGEKQIEQWEQWCASVEESPSLYVRLDCRRLYHLLSHLVEETSDANLADLAKSLSSLRILLEMEKSSDRPLPFRLGLSRKMLGYHRSGQYVAMNLSSVPPNEFPLQSLHTRLHHNDRILGFASNHFKELFESSDLQSAVWRRDMVDTGLDINFLGEWRSWLDALEIYRGAVKKNLWKRVPSIEAIFPGRDSLAFQGNLAVFLFDFMAPQFLNPDFGIFAMEPLKFDLKERREQLDPEYLPLGSLDSIRAAALSDLSM